MTLLQLKFVDNAHKHGVTENEIWEVLSNTIVRCVVVKYKKSGNQQIYNAFGVTDSGRYLTIGFVKETEQLYRVIHAMDMKPFERTRFKKLRRI